MTTRALRTLLEGAIDYAGLFPPAALPMAEAAANYHAYRQGDDAWALGRFVVPVARLGEFAEAASGLWPHGETAAPWRVSAVLGGGDPSANAGQALAAEVEAVAAFNTRHGRSGGIVPDGERGGAWVDTAELRCVRPDDVHAAREAIPRWVETYVEVPVTGDPEPLVRAIADAGLKAKIRTGGVTAGAFPTAAQVARFMSHCARCRVPFKATAGLHHPLRAEFPLTYEKAAPAATMFGYVNVLLAAVYVRHGMDETSAAQLLEERDATAIADLGDAIEWRGHRLAADALRAAHSDFMLAFGSCSFTDPMREGRALGLI